MGDTVPTVPVAAGVADVTVDVAMALGEATTVAVAAPVGVSTALGEAAGVSVGVWVVVGDVTVVPTADGVPTPGEPATVADAATVAVVPAPLTGVDVPTVWTAGTVLPGPHAVATTMTKPRTPNRPKCRNIGRP